MAASASVIKAGLSGPLAAAGVDLESVEVQRAGRREMVRVVVDADGGVDLDTVASVSQIVAGLLDESPLADQFAGAYVLEVTSPGVDRPLTEPKHWRRAVRRLVVATRRDGSTVTGRIEAVDDEAVSLAVGDELLAISFADLTSGTVQVEFNREES